MDTVMFILEALLVGALGTWMSVAVYDNWRHPKLNEEAVAMVMRFDLMERDYPDDFSIVAHRKIKNPATIHRLFQAIRLAETAAAVALVVAAVLLLGAAVGVVGPVLATGFALLSTAYFTLIWSGFIIGGNYFHYYYCHQWGQSNHFMFMYWGFFVLLVLLI